MKRKRIGITALLLIAGVGACAATSTPPAAPENRNGQPSETPVGEHGSLAALAMKTLSEHLSVPVKELEIVSITPIEWRDSSLGCPKPDRGYMQVITPGHVVVLGHGGRKYSVHMAGKRAFVCEPAVGSKAEKITPIAVPVILSLERIAEQARTDLAARLGVSVEDITVAVSRRVEWADTSIGCPKPREDYMIQRSKGYVLDLKHRGRVYSYHSDLRRVIPCPDVDRN